MIPLPPWLTLRLVATVVLALALFGAGWKAGSGLTEARWQRAAVKAEREQAASLARAREAERASYAKAQQVSYDYQQKLAEIRAERDRLRDRPVRPVRLCVEPARASVPATGTAAGGPGATATATAAPAAAAGPDIGPGLYSLADDGDEREAALAAQIRSLQAKCGMP